MKVEGQYWYVKIVNLLHICMMTNNKNKYRRKKEEGRGVKGKGARSGESGEEKVRYM